MSNTKNLANLAAALDDGTSGQVLQSTGSGGVAFADAGGSGVTTHTNQDAMVSADASSAYTEGSLHYDLNSNKLFVKMADSAGAGFYQIAAITNATPTISSPTTGTSFTLDSTGSPTTISVTASDDDVGQTLNYYYTVSTGSIGSGTTITTSATSGGTYSSSGNAVAGSSNASTNSHFRITPSTSVATDFSLTFYVTDGTNIANTICSFSLAFTITDSHYTTLLMATDGSAGNNQDDISDSSSSNHTVTVNGDAHAGTFSPYRHGGYSVEFDGTTDSIYWAAGSSNYLGQSSAFTLEFWYYLDQAQTYTFLDTYNTSNTRTLRIYTTSTHFYVYNGSSNILALARTQEAGVWEHFCWTRDASNNHVFYINGQQVGTSTATRNMQTHYWNIGKQAGTYNNEYLDGYIRDFRYVQGSVITPSSGGPTEPLTAVTNTSLLICHLPYIADGSSNDHSITVNGDPNTKPIGPYDYVEYRESDNGGSVYFDGTTNTYLNVSSSAGGIAIGSGDFTISFWVYANDATTPNYLLDYRPLNTSTGNYPHIRIHSDGTFKYNIGGTTVITGNTTISSKQWAYFCLARDNGTTRMYVNGTLQTATYSGTESLTNGTNRPVMGAGAYAITPMFDGYISDLRVVTSLDTNAYAVPTSPLSADSNTILHIKGTDAHVLDKSQGNNLKLVGDAAAVTNATNNSNISSTNAVSFDDSGDYVSATVDPPNTGDFSCEAWVRFNSLSAGNQIICSFGSYSPALFYRSASNDIAIYHSTPFYTSGFTPSANTWYHIAMAREGTSMRVFIDGTQYGTTATYSTNITNTELRIGYDGVDYFGGYIQDFRYTKGLARHVNTNGTYTYPVPSSPLKG